MSLKSKYNPPDPYEKGYAVIANFYADPNEVIGCKDGVGYIEESDGSQEPIVEYNVFLNIVLDFVQRHGAVSVFESDDTIVISCDEERFRKLRQELEPLKFSLFHASDPTYRAFLHANAERYGRSPDSFNPCSPNFVSPVSKEGAQRAPVLKGGLTAQSFLYIN